MLLGEKLIAFRDTRGPRRHHGPPLPAPLRLAVLRPQRGRRHALRLSRLEVRRRRQLPRHAEPARRTSASRSKVKAKAYKVAERGGVVWVYMGEREVPPPLPALEVLGLPADERIVMCHQRDCNWLQALEGDIDTSHFGFLHAGVCSPTTSIPTTMHRYGGRPRAAVPCRETDWGTMYDGLPPGRSRQPTSALRQLPVPVLRAGAGRRLRQHDPGALSVPLDDSHTMPTCWPGRSAPGAAHAQGRQPDSRRGARPATSCRPPPTGSAAGASRPTRATTS